MVATAHEQARNAHGNRNSSDLDVEMHAKIQWIDNVQFEAISGSGHRILIDGPPESGGQNKGARPMEMMLLGLGGCTSFDVMSILKKSRQQVTDCVTQLTAERDEETPAVFTDIHIHFTVTGINLDAKKVDRAISLSADKYCSASIMLSRAGVNITHDSDLIQEADDE
jgi:putative redox protein